MAFIPCRTSGGAGGKSAVAACAQRGRAITTTRESLQEMLVRNPAPPTLRECPPVPRNPAPQTRILVPGRNCWRLERASKAAVLVDASDYYARLAGALQRAEQSILIVGWDFDGRIKLCPGDEECPMLGDFLLSLVEAKPQLEIHILVWSFAVIHAPSAPLPLIVGAPWQDHPRVHIRLDRKHPFYASHHQKLVCIDDALAFCGGMDLTVRRWDTCGHDETHPHRLDPAGAAYKPVHDVQMVVAGDAARAVADVARERWQRATGQVLTAIGHATDVWPDDLEPEHIDVPVGVSRTAPGWGDAPPVDEIAALTIDMLSVARQSIYIETQYFTSRAVRDWMVRSLAPRRGPEIVVIAKRSLSGNMERLVMETNRDRAVRRIRQADRHNRFRIVYPIVPGECGACEVSMHAKVMIIDDEIMRVGSSNLNNRSMGLDTECDLTIEARDDETRRAIAGVRDRLLAEHLDVSPEVVAETMGAQQSLIRTIDRLNHRARGLRPLPETRLGGPLGSIPGTWLLDPPRPFEPLWWLRRKRGRQS
jgi:phosphatidylserine/phosphatidylglycerophosphate/cardiolipin synthase-like enzyme